MHDSILGQPCDEKQSRNGALIGFRKDVHWRGTEILAPLAGYYALVLYKNRGKLTDCIKIIKDY